MLGATRAPRRLPKPGLPWGLIFGAGAVGGLLGALTAAWIPRRIGLGPTLFVTVLLGGLSLILVPLAQYGFAIPLLFASMFFGSFAYEGFTPYSDQQKIDEQTKRNKRRRLLQRTGLGLLMLSFVLAGFSVVLN